MAQKNIKYLDGEFTINYEILNKENKRAILFLHGWGSSKEIMKQAFGKSFREYKHIYIDMPGFGKSPTDKILKTMDYKSIVEIFIKDIGEEPSVIFGHSFGGKVATLLKPKNLILLSTAGILEPKPFKIKAKVALFKILKPFGGKKVVKFFATKDVEGLPQNMYETIKNVVNEDFSQEFEGYKGNCQIFWGISDKAVSLSSGEKINSLVENSVLYPIEGDHYFFLSKADEIESKISLK